MATLSRTNITANKNLPSLQLWMNPNYKGLISTFDHLELHEEVNLPNNWMDDFPDNNYKFLALTKLLSADVVPYSFEKLEIPYVEKVDNTWLDFYELYIDVLEGFKRSTFGGTKKPTLTKYMRYTEGKVLNSFHYNYTAPVVASLNHYVRTRMNVPWEWLATSVSTLRQAGLRDNFSHLKNEDHFGEKVRLQGLFAGVDGDGDFTKDNNIRCLNTGSQLFTACVGISTKQFIASVICMAKTLLREGTAIIQMDVCPGTLSSFINVIHILSCVFKKVEIVRGIGLYVVGRGYTGISKIYLNRLLNILTYIRDINDECVPAIFEKSTIPSELITKLSIALQSRPISKKSTWFVDMGILEIKEHHMLFVDL